MSKTKRPSFLQRITRNQRATIQDIGKKVVSMVLPGRRTAPFENSYYGAFAFIPRADRYSNVDWDTLLRDKSCIDIGLLLKILPQIDPDLSMALWNYRRLAGSEWTVEAYTDDERENVNLRATRVCKSFLRSVNAQSGGVDGLVSRMVASAYLQGAVATELAINERKRGKDILAVDPFTIFFRPELDKEGFQTGYLESFQYQGMNPQAPAMAPDQKLAPGLDAGFVQLNPFTFWYIPLDPMVYDPYGTSPAAPAISDVLFCMGVMRDLRLVIANQAWPRLEVKVLTSVLVDNAPAAIKADPKQLQDWISNQLSAIQSDFEQLRPDDTWIHTDAVEGGQLRATSDSRMFDPEPILRALERRITRGLKMLPILMGSNEGTTETHGGLQIKVFAMGIDSVQKVVETAISNALDLMLRLEGISAIASFKLTRPNIIDRKTEAEAEAVEIENAARKRDEGWITNDEASTAITGGAAVDEPYRKEDVVGITNADLSQDEQDVEDEDNTDTGTRSFLAQRGSKKAPRRQTKGEYKRREKQLHADFLKLTDKFFMGMRKHIDAKYIAEQLISTYPYADETRAPQQNDPIYNAAMGILNEFFSTEEARELAKNMSVDGARILTAAFENRGQSVIGSLAKDSKNYTYQTFRLNDIGLKKLIEDRGNFFSQSVYETSKKEIATAVVDGYRKKLTVEELASKIRNRFENMTIERSVIIANTELNWATSQGALQTMIRNNITKKRWQSVNDNRVRESHRLNQRQGAIGVGEAFQSGDMAPPGEPNCRCTLLEVIEDWEEPAEPWVGGLA